MSLIYSKIRAFKLRFKIIKGSRIKMADKLRFLLDLKYWCFLDIQFLLIFIERCNFLLYIIL